MPCTAGSTNGVRILKESYSAWAMGDIAESLTHFSPNAVYALHLPKDIVPFGGETRGIALLVPRLRQILDVFHILTYTPVLMTEQDGCHHVVVRYHYRHKKSGQEIDGTMRHVVHIVNDVIVRFDEYHDIERIRAFFKLLGP